MEIVAFCCHNSLNNISRKSKDTSIKVSLYQNAFKMITRRQGGGDGSVLDNTLEKPTTKPTLVKFECKLVLLPCSSKIEVGHLLSTFERGADGVMVIGCQGGKCQFVDGSIMAKGRVLYTKRLLNEIGLGEEKIEFFTLSNGEGFLEAVEIMKERV